MIKTLLAVTPRKSIRISTLSEGVKDKELNYFLVGYLRSALSVPITLKGTRLKSGFDVVPLFQKKCKSEYSLAKSPFRSLNL